MLSFFEKFPVFHPFLILIPLFPRFFFHVTFFSLSSPGSICNYVIFSTFTESQAGHHSGQFHPFLYKIHSDELSGKVPTLLGYRKSFFLLVRQTFMGFCSFFEIIRMISGKRLGLKMLWKSNVSHQGRGTLAQMGTEQIGQVSWPSLAAYAYTKKVCRLGNIYLPSTATKL